MAETFEMESPSAHQASLVEAQEDSTSVEAELVNASSSAMADMNGDAERGSAGSGKEDLVMVVCQRHVNEELKDEREPEEEGHSNELSQKLEEEKEEEDEEEEEEEEKEEEVELELKMSEEISEESNAMSPMDSFRSDESCRIDDILDQVPQDQQARCEKSSSSSRKRPADNDFLPINAEIKRIGVEISEEEATQLRNDVRRLSPVLVSLRERTLGEVSLTSKSCLLGDELDNRAIPKDNDISEKSSERGHHLQLQQTDQDSRDFNCADEKEEEKEEVRIDVTSQEYKDNNRIIAEDPTDYASGKISYDSEKESLDLVMVPSPESNRTAMGSSSKASCASNMKIIDASSSPSPIFRRLSVMLNRIEETNTKNLTSKNPHENCAKIEDPSCSNRRWNFMEEERSSHTAEARENQKKPRCQNDSLPMTRSKKYKSVEEIRSTNSLRECKVILERIDNVQQNTVTAVESPQIAEGEESTSVMTIDKAGEDEEMASSPVGNNQASHELDSSETMPNSPEVTPDASVDVAEGADTETETETGSDSSEVSPIASIRELRDVDMSAEHQLPCVEGEPLCCVETMAPIMTRLEAERPEAYTEDSAESLALATGARDEVRSDGSDSGLGNEIPGDPGPAPAPESDSETSFLDRLPDDILSDKEKGKKTGKKRFPQRR